MARLITQYVCQSCGSVSPKWMGKCPDCGEWNTLIEEIAESGSKKKTDASIQPEGPVLFVSVEESALYVKNLEERLVKNPQNLFLY